MVVKGDHDSKINVQYNLCVYDMTYLAYRVFKSNESALELSPELQWYQKQMHFAHICWVKSNEEELIEQLTTLQW